MSDFLRQVLAEGRETPGPTRLVGKLVQWVWRRVRRWRRR
jgi:hypothetical protein